MNQAIFEDRKGRKWDVTFTLAGARRVDASDFTELMDEPFSILEPNKQVFHRILTDTKLLFAIMWAIVQPQVKDVMGIDPAEDYERAEEEFVDGLDGTSIESGRKVFWGSLASFFPEHKTVLLMLLEELEQAHKTIGEELQTMRPEIHTELQATIKEGMTELKEDLRMRLKERGATSTE